MLLGLLIVLRQGVEAQQRLEFTSISPNGLRLVWSDEFNGNGAPDSIVWNFEEGFVRNQEAQWYQAANAWQQDGCLVIEARREHRSNPTYDPTSRHWGKKREFIDYTSACLTTAGKTFVKL